MTLSERLQQIVGAGARIAQAEGGFDTAAAEHFEEVDQRPVTKPSLAETCAPHAGSSAPLADFDSDADVDARLDNVPSVNQQDHGASALRDDSLQARGDKFEHPRRLAHHLA